MRKRCIRKLRTGKIMNLDFKSSGIQPRTSEVLVLVSSIIACSLVAGETFPQNCSLATAVVLSPDYKPVTWQMVSTCRNIKMYKKEIGCESVVLI
jgi:hypothetical protein